MKKVMLASMVLAAIIVLNACTVTPSETNTSYSPNSTITTTQATEPPKEYLTGAELERIDTMLEGTYQYTDKGSGYPVEYAFADGQFVCYTQIADTTLENWGTYKLTTTTIEMSFQNGTEKTWTWEIREDGQLWVTPD